MVDVVVVDSVVVAIIKENYCDQENELCENVQL